MLNIGEIVEKSYVLVWNMKRINSKSAKASAGGSGEWIAVNGYDPDIKGDWEDYMSSLGTTMTSG